VTSAAVTSPVDFCLPVKVPVDSVSEGVSRVALSVAATVGIVVGAIVALVVGWLVFRQCLSKVCRLLYIYLFIHDEDRNIKTTQKG